MKKNVLSYFGKRNCLCRCKFRLLSHCSVLLWRKSILLMNSSDEVTSLGLKYINVIFLGTIFIYISCSIKFIFTRRRWYYYLSKCTYFFLFSKYYFKSYIYIWIFIYSSIRNYRNWSSNSNCSICFFSDCT
jgi:hypothetical protein